MRHLTAFWALIALISPVFAFATVVVHATIEQMTQSAPVIVRGVARNSYAAFDEHHRRIWTYTELTVAEAIKGEAKGTVVIRQPGGVVGESGQYVDGVAQFSPGEECVLFLYQAPDEPAVYGVERFAAGKITFKERLGVVTALRDLRGLGFAKAGGRAIQQVDEPEVLGPAEQLLSRVRKAAGRSR